MLPAGIDRDIVQQQMVRRRDQHRDRSDGAVAFQHEHFPGGDVMRVVVIHRRRATPDGQHPGSIGTLDQIADGIYLFDPCQPDQAAVPPTVSPASFSVGCPTPTGSLWPFLPQLPTPGSSAMLLPTMVTLVSASGPLPISVAPFTGAV